MTKRLRLVNYAYYLIDSLEKKNVQLGGRVESLHTFRYCCDKTHTDYVKKISVEIEKPSKLEGISEFNLGEHSRVEADFFPINEDIEILLRKYKIKYTYPNNKIKRKIGKVIGLSSKRTRFGEENWKKGRAYLAVRW